MKAFVESENRIGPAVMTVYYKSLGHSVLLCAASNTAVDVLVLRVDQICPLIYLLQFQSTNVEVEGIFSEQGLLLVPEVKGTTTKAAELHLEYLDGYD